MKNQGRGCWVGIQALCLLVVLGCVSYRHDFFAFVEKCDETNATKYRYKIVGYQAKASKYFTHEQRKEVEEFWLAEYASACDKYFPKVFSEDGIPIILKEISSTYDGEWCLIPLGFWMFAVLPCGTEIKSEHIIQICVANSEDEEYYIKAGHITKEIISSLIPPSLLINNEPSEYVRDAGYVVSYRRDTIFNDGSWWAGPYKDACCRRDVYALVSKLKEIEATGQMDYYFAANELRRRTVASRMSPNDAKYKLSNDPLKRLYKILTLDRKSGSDFVYTFALEPTEDVTITAFFGMMDIFAYEVKAAYQREFPTADASTLQVDVRHQVSDGKIVGQAEVLTIKPVELKYDVITRKGKMAVRFNDNQYDEARKWIRDNIEKLVRDKNIALVARDIPPEVKYYSLGESLKDGNILEIEFKTE